MPDDAATAASTAAAAASPQGERRRIIFPSSIGTSGTPAFQGRVELFNEIGPDTVFMMGDNPALA